MRAFVIRAKRDRLITLLGNPRRRRKARDSLNHFDGWDARFVEPVKSTADVLAILRKAGAPSVCHVISDDAALDGRDVPLTDAVDAANSYSFASVLCCVPGRLAFYFDEVYTPRRLLLLRRSGVTC